MPDVDPDRELFNDVARLCNGRPQQHVWSLAINLLVNVIRQNYGLRSEAEYRLQWLHAKCKEELLSNYDSVTGRRRSVVPYTQVITMGRHEEEL